MNPVFNKAPRSRATRYQKLKYSHLPQQSCRKLNPKEIKYRFILTALFVLFIPAFLTKCEMPLPSQSFRPDMLINNYKTTSYKNGNIEWILTADKAAYFYDEKRTIATNIVLNYFKEDKETAEVKADQAVIYSDSMDIDLIGNVDMLSTTGNRLLTEKITWNNRKGYLDNDDPIKITRKNGDIIEGEGLRADYNLESYEIKKDIKAITSNIDKEIK